MQHGCKIMAIIKPQINSCQAVNNPCHLHFLISLHSPLRKPFYVGMVFFAQHTHFDVLFST